MRKIGYDIKEKKIWKDLFRKGLNTELNYLVSSQIIKKKSLFENLIGDFVAGYLNI